MNEKHLELRPDEHVITTVRRHWYRLAIEAGALVFIFIIVLVVTGLAETLLLAVRTPDLSLSKPLALGAFMIGLFGLLLWMRFFALWSDHWLDVWLVTDQRIIDIEQKGFFSREVSSFPLERIQDVTYEVHGLIATWLHFGDVRVQTASISNDFIMRQVPFPDLVKGSVMSVLENKKPHQ